MAGPADTQGTPQKSAEELDIIEATRAAKFFADREIDLGAPPGTQRGPSPQRQTVSGIAEAELEEEEGDGPDEETAMREAGFGREEEDEEEGDEPPPRAARAPAAAPLSAAELEQIATAIVGKATEPDSTSAHYWRRQTEKLERAVAELQGQMEAFGRRPSEAAPPAGPEASALEGEEQLPVEFFDDPDKWAEQKFNQFAKPYQEKIDALEAQLATARVKEMQEDIRSLERQYDESPEGRGYLQRVQVFRRLFIEEQTKDFGFTEEQARENLRMRDAAILNAAMRLKKHPAWLNDKDIRRWVAAGAPGSIPARAAAAPPPDRRVAAETAARSSAVAGTLSNVGEAELDETGEGLASVGLSAAAAVRAIQKGRSNFFALAQRAEAAARRRR